MPWHPLTVIMLPFSLLVYSLPSCSRVIFIVDLRCIAFLRIFSRTGMNVGVSFCCLLPIVRPYRRYFSEWEISTCPRCVSAPVQCTCSSGSPFYSRTPPFWHPSSSHPSIHNIFLLFLKTTVHSSMWEVERESNDVPLHLTFEMLPHAEFRYGFPQRYSCTDWHTKIPFPQKNLKPEVTHSFITSFLRIPACTYNTWIQRISQGVIVNFWIHCEGCIPSSIFFCCRMRDDHCLNRGCRS